MYRRRPRRRPADSHGFISYLFRPGWQAFVRRVVVGFVGLGGFIPAAFPDSGRIPVGGGSVQGALCVTLVGCFLRRLALRSPSHELVPDLKKLFYC